MSDNQEPQLDNELREDINNKPVADGIDAVEEKKKQANVSKTQAMAKDEIIENLKNLAAQKEVPLRTEVEVLKQAYYKLRSEETEKQKEKFVEEGNALEEFVVIPDPSDEVLKVYLGEIKKKRAELLAKEEEQKEKNYKKKLEIIDKIKGLTESTDDFSKLYKEFKDLQQEWNDVKQVPASKEKDLWQSYQRYTEVFYDLIKINNEFRDYDFKKNLELKTIICDSVEKLIDEPDVISAFHQLQNFHQQWREIGPIAKELREELWSRFKQASTTINKNYQTHFESLKGKEDENLAKKTAIIESLKNIDYSLLNSMKSWDEKSKEVIALQVEWKTIGFVPKKVNTQIFEEFRKLCDTFFETKSNFFKEIKDDMDQNLEKKKMLCERAEALKNSTDWKNTTDELIAIQKEWKKIGTVPRKFSDAIWKDFVSACDYFFEQKKKSTNSQRAEEDANLIAKKEITEKIKEIDTSLDAQKAIETLRELTEKWHQIGFVPFKEKDAVYKEFHNAVDAHYDRLKVDKSERRLDAFKSNIEDLSKSDNPKRKLQRERDRLMHTYNKLKSDLQTYENNMNFLSISSKGANSLLKEVNHKVDDLRNEMGLIEKKITSIDESIGQMN